MEFPAPEKSIVAESHQSDDKLIENLEIGERKGVIREWNDNWFCYWDGGFGVPIDTQKNYVFSPNLEMTKNGMIRTKDWRLLEHNSVSDVKQALEELLEIDKSKAHGKEIGLGDESDYPWHPIMIPWTDQDPALNPKAFLEKLGAHEELKKEGSIKVIDTSKKFEPVDDEDKIGNISVFLEKYEHFLYFCTGSELLNPLVVIAVAQMKPCLVGGFMGGIVHT